jgi:hypothetical protein
MRTANYPPVALTKGEKQMSPKEQQTTAQIMIQVHESDQPTGEKAGTFHHPYPKVVVGTDRQVKWKLLNQNATFELTFSGSTSPFSSNELSISDEEERTAVTPGLYHYAVRVTTGGKDYVIANCPEFEVTGGT